MKSINFVFAENLAPVHPHSVVMHVLLFMLFFFFQNNLYPVSDERSLTPNWVNAINITDNLKKNIYFVQFMVTLQRNWYLLNLLFQQNLWDPSGYKRRVQRTEWLVEPFIVLKSHIRKFSNEVYHRKCYTQKLFY